MVMTYRQLLERLARCRFAPASFDKRFVRQTAEYAAKRDLTAKEKALLAKFGHTYRKQLGQCCNPACSICEDHIDELADCEGTIAIQGPVAPFLAQLRLEL